MQHQSETEHHKVDLKIIGLLLSAETALHVFPSDNMMIDSALQVLNKIPGISRCSICVKEISNPVGSLVKSKCDKCELWLAGDNDKSGQKCRFTNESGFDVFSLNTAFYFFGFLIIEVTDSDKYHPYAPLIHNFANAISMVMENRRQKEQLSLQNRELQRHRDNLEILVQERTASHEKSERLLSRSQEISHAGGWEYDIVNQTMHWTDEMYRLHGFNPNDLPSNTASHIEKSLECYDPKDRSSILAAFNKCIHDGQEYDHELPLTKIGGEKIWIRTIAKPVFLNGKIVRVIGNFIDITKQKQARRKLEISETQQRTILKTAIDGFWLTDLNGQFLDINDAYCHMSGYSKAELLQMNIADLEANEKAEDIAAHIQKLKIDGKDRFETRHRRKDGQFFDLEVNAQYQPFEDGQHVAFLKDITERKKADKKIKDSLIEKETLLQEIHHRVKNNMQVINSLLSLQLKNVKDENVKNALKESQNRIYVMSAVHETLHRSENLSEVNLKLYLSKITNTILQTYTIDPNKVELITNIEEILINISQASPLGLVVNELISNALKHAFPDMKKGEIHVTIKKFDQKLILTVMDNGVGISGGLDWKHTKSLGLKLVYTLVENQLNGSLDMESKNGTKFIVQFNIES